MPCMSKGWHPYHRQPGVFLHCLLCKHSHMWHFHTCLSLATHVWACFGEWGGVGWAGMIPFVACAHMVDATQLCCWLHAQPMGWMVNAIKTVLNRLIQFRRNPLSRFLHHTVWWFLYVFVASGRGGCGGVGGACDFLFFHTETTVPALVVWALGLRRQRGATKGKGLCNFDS